MEILPNVHQVPGLRGTNVYLLLGEAPTLVDAGMAAHAGPILDYLQAQGLAPGDLARIVVTHHHLDHVGGLAVLVERTGARVLAHPADAAFISGQATPPSPGGFGGLLLRLLAPLLPAAARVPVDGSLQDGDQIDLLGGATVVHVPGHTPGSIALHLPTEGVLLCGDVIDHRRGRLGPPPKAFTADMDQALASLRRLAELDFDTLCPGHGPPLTDGAGDKLRAMVRDLSPS